MVVFVGLQGSETKQWDQGHVQVQSILYIDTGAKISRVTDISKQGYHGNKRVLDVSV